MQKRRTVNTPYGSYTEILDDLLPLASSEVDDFMSFYNDYKDEKSLFNRINRNVDQLSTLSNKEDCSLEEVASVFHSLIHKVTEGITTGDHKQAKRAYNIIQKTLPKFGLPE